MESVVDIVGKFINSNISPNISGVNENNEINVIKVPEELVGGSYKYLDLFKALIDQKKQIIPLAIVRQANHQPCATGWPDRLPAEVHPPIKRV